MGLIGEAGCAQEEAAGLGWVCCWFEQGCFLFFFSKLDPNYLNSNLNLNSTLALKQIKQCTSMNATTSLNLEIFLITL